jgi:hypothetical protein
MDAIVVSYAAELNRWGIETFKNARPQQKPGVGKFIGLDGDRGGLELYNSYLSSLNWSIIPIDGSHPLQKNIVRKIPKQVWCARHKSSNLRK